MCFNKIELNKGGRHMTGKERKARQEEFEHIPEVDLEYTDFGTRIRQLRSEMGMSQVEFAEKLGLSKQILSLYEAGKRSPKIAQVKKFAEILKVSVDYLLGDSAEEAAFYSVCSTQEKPFYKIFIEVTYDQMGLDIPGIVRVTGLTDRQVRTIITRRMKEALIALQPPIRWMYRWRSGERFLTIPILFGRSRRSGEASATLRTKNTAGWR
ncbi:MAG: helix-turn-helix domain-containing protein [Acutalibacteraceae bacterium]